MLKILLLMLRNVGNILPVPMFLCESEVCILRREDGSRIRKEISEVHSKMLKKKSRLCKANISEALICLKYIVNIRQYVQLEINVLQSG